MQAERYDLSFVANNELLEVLGALVAREREVSADVVAHFAEVDLRKLYLEQGCASMFSYAVEVLGYDEGQAYKRIQAARAARRFPVICRLIARRELHLSGITLLAPHLTEDNHLELLTLSKGKSKRAIEELVAARFPRADARAQLRKLPERKAEPGACSPPESRPGCMAASRPSLAMAAVSPAAESPLSECPAESTTAGRSPGTWSQAAARGPESSLQPLAVERYRLQVTLTKKGRDSLERAQELLGYDVKHGDWAAICELALSSFVEQLERRKFAKTPRARKARMEPAEPGTEAGPPPDAKADLRPLRPEVAEVEPHPGQQPRSRHIPAAVKRAVAARDGYQCTFLGADGRRCQERRHLEFHHQEAFARQGESSLENLRLLCRAHNGHQAQLDFGVEHIETAIKKRRVLSPGTGTKASPEHDLGRDPDARNCPGRAGLAWPGGSAPPLGLAAHSTA